MPFMLLYPRRFGLLATVGSCLNLMVAKRTTRVEATFFGKLLPNFDKLVFIVWIPLSEHVWVE